MDEVLEVVFSIFVLGGEEISGFSNFLLL